MSKEEVVGFKLRENTHTWRTEIPNCVLECGLNPNQLAVYIEVKKVAGDQGSCFKSIDAIAESCVMSRSTVQRSLEILCKINPILGTPLIEKTSQTRTNGATSTNSYEVVDLWSLNMKLLEEKKIKKQIAQVTKNRGGVPKEQGGVFTENMAYIMSNKIPNEKDPNKQSATVDKKIIEKVEPKPSARAAAAPKSFILFTNARGKQESIEESTIFRNLIDYPTHIVQQAIEKMQSNNSPIGNVLKFLEAICQGLINSPKSTVILNKLTKTPCKYNTPTGKMMKWDDKLAEMEAKKNEQKQNARAI